MSRLFWTSIGLLLSVCILHSQELSFTQSFKSNLPEDLVRTKVEEYCSDILGFQIEERESTRVISGNFDTFDWTRKGNQKMLYSASFEMTSSRTGNNNTTCKIDIKSVTKTTITCNQAQTLYSEVLTSGGDLSESSSKLKSTTKFFVQCLSDYVNNGKVETDISRSTLLFGLTPRSRASWIELPYIVDEKEVTYFKVLTSSSNLSKEDLFIIAEKYLIYAGTEIKTKDENRSVILGKGVFSDVITKREGDYYISYETPYMISTECRDGKVRVSITVQEIIRNDESRFADIAKRKPKIFKIVEYAPFGRGGRITAGSTITKDPLEITENMILEQFNAIQKSFDTTQSEQGSTSLSDEW